MRVLVIEDEKKTGAYLKKGLEEHGFVTDVSPDGEQGLDLALAEDYDLVVVDVMLPGLDGWSVVTRMRSAGRQTPVIFLTARDGVQDRVKGLELGADDYLVKPFAFSELLARMRSILRRNQDWSPLRFEVGDLVVDLGQHRVTRAGRRVDLTPKEFALLSLLVRHQGVVLSRTLISEQVWDMNFDSDSNVVDVAIRRLRKKVDEPHHHKLIHTVRGVGYVLEER